MRTSNIWKNPSPTQSEMSALQLVWCCRTGAGQIQCSYNREDDMLLCVKKAVSMSTILELLGSHSLKLENAQIGAKGTERTPKVDVTHSLFDSSPWLTILISTITEPLIMVLLLLTFGPCINNKLSQYMKQRLGTIQLMVTRSQYQPASIDNMGFQRAQACPHQQRGDY